MGHRLSCLKGEEQDNEVGWVDTNKGEGDGAAFSEEVKIKSPDREDKKQKRRRKSSGVSRFSTRDQHVVERPFRVAAFNVRRFGLAKMQDKKVVEVLVNIVRQFDIILIQEVVDTSGRALQELLEAINYIGFEEDAEYAMVISPRLGRGKQKEQYAFFYRAGRVDVVGQDMYPDPGDLYMREPFMVQFNVRSVASLSTITLLALHTQPTSAAKEIDCLVEVVEWAKATDTSILILGDLNAGGSYFTGPDLASCRLRQDSQYRWLIPDHMDTTATSTLAAYDRLIVVGDELFNAVIPNTAGVLRFDEDHGLGQEELLKVSDHFPVCLDLRPAVHPTVEKNIDCKLAIMVRDRRFPEIDFEDLQTTFKVPRFKMTTLYDDKQQLAQVEMRSQKLSSKADVMKCLENLRVKIDGLISYSLLSAVKHKVICGEATDTSIKGKEEQSMWLSIVADVVKKDITCFVEMKTCIT